MDESVVRMNAAHKEHNQRAKDILATSIVNEAVELEVCECIETKTRSCFSACVASS